jgi:thymidylate synthase
MKVEDKQRVRLPRAFYTADFEIRDYQTADAIYMEVLSKRYMKRKEYLPLGEYILWVTTEFLDKNNQRVLIALTTEHIEILDSDRASQLQIKTHSIDRIVRESETSFAIFGYTTDRTKKFKILNGENGDRVEKFLEKLKASFVDLGVKLLVESAK